MRILIERIHDKALFCLFAMLAAVLLQFVQPATASAQGLATPPGSYMRTCANVAYDPVLKLLKAQCRITPNGDFMGTNLNVSYCDPSADIEQLNGWLQCKAKAGTWGSGGAVPSGSYQKSCDHYYVQMVARGGGTYPRLAARCTYPSLPPSEFLLDLSQCSMSPGTDIAWYGDNGYGTLTCAPVSRTTSGTSAPQAVPQQQQQQTAPMQQRSSGTMPMPRTLAKGPTPAPGTCKPGFMWRMADATDHVCVTPETHQQVAMDNEINLGHTSNVPNAPVRSCPQGYVWREANATDHICVRPSIRKATAEDNALAPSRTY